MHSATTPLQPPDTMDQPSPALSKGEQFLQDNKEKDGVITLPSGLQYKVLVEGSGLKRPLVDTPCDCHYLGTLIDGTQFDSSFDRGSRRRSPRTRSSRAGRKPCN